MRQGCFLLCLLVILIFLGCNDDDFVVHSGLVEQVQRVYPTYTNKLLTFDYDEIGKVVSVNRDIGYRGISSINYFYDSAGALIKFSESNCETCFSGKATYKNGLLLKSTSFISGYVYDNKRKISTYNYNTDNQRISQIDTTITDAIINNTYLPDTTIIQKQFNYNSQGNIISMKVFDEKGNLLSEREFEYDDRINPFFRKNSSFFGGVRYFSCPNNITRTTILINDSTRVLESFYSYDNLGFPTEIRKGASDNYLQLRYK